MITNLSLRDFQSWKELDLELAPITMIVGRGDVGKSAIVRAVTYALTNQGGDAFIRHGALQTRVGLAFDNGLALLWTKPRGAGAVYRLVSPEGIQEFTKTGQSVPTEVEAATGFRAIEVDKNYSVSPQLSQQFDKPFIVGESGSRTARILGKLTRLDVLVQAQVLCRREKETWRKGAETAKEEVAYYEQRLAELPDVKALEEAYLEVRAQVQETRALQERVELAEKAIQTIASYASQPDAREIAALRESLGEAREASAAFEAGRAAKDTYDRAVVKWADAGVNLDEARFQLVGLKTLYEEHCEAKGVCETCPWK